jgi:hypothetical protein
MSARSSINLTAADIKAMESQAKTHNRLARQKKAALSNRLMHAGTAGGIYWALYTITGKQRYHDRTIENTSYSSQLVMRLRAK